MLIARLALALGLLAGAADAADGPTYRVIQTFPAVAGSYDYASVDAATGTLYVGRGYGAMALDLATGKARTLVKRDGVAAVLLVPETPWMLTTNGETNTVTLLDRHTGEVWADIPVGTEPDGAFYDTATGLIAVMNGGSNDVSLIDPKTARQVGKIPVGGVPEGAVGDGAGRLFVNIEDLNAVEVIDLKARKVTGRYGLTGCDEPTGITYDPVAGLLISVCRSGVAKLIDAASGQDRGGFAVCSRPDGSLFDARSRRGFIPCIDGNLTVYTLDAAGKATITQTVKTREGARTAAYDAKSQRLYLPAAKVERDAQGKYLRAEQAFEVLVVAPEYSVAPTPTAP